MNKLRLQLPDIEDLIHHYEDIIEQQPSLHALFADKLRDLRKASRADNIELIWWNDDDEPI